jgi:ATP-binding cassette, subfamily B, bacterial
MSASEGCFCQAVKRVFLKNPPVLLLDEATSALDTQTELRIQHALERLSKGRTCIVIAHRLSTIRRADEIIYLSENGIEEQGTHEELLNRKGSYSELYHVQFADLS